MTLLNTTYLWGLLALAVPLAIHLLNRGNVKTIKVGSIKFLPNTETKQARSIRLNELLLLFLRSLVLVLLVLILTKPNLKTQLINTSLVYLVEPSLLKDDKLDSFLGGLSGVTEIRLLKEGFQELSEVEELTANTLPNYWQLVGDMEDLAADSIVVISKGLVSGLKGVRPQTKANINWMVLANESTKEDVLLAEIIKDSVRLLNVESSSEFTRVEKTFRAKNEAGFSIENDSLVFNASKQPAVSLKAVDSISVGIIYQQAFTYEASYFEKAFQVISRYSRIPIHIDLNTNWEDVKNREHEVLVWLSLKEPPQTKNKLISYQPDSLERDVIVDGPTKSDYELTRRLNIEEVLNGNLTNKLLALLDLNENVEEVLVYYDQRTMAKEELMPTVIGSNNTNEKIENAALVDISMWLWAALAIIILIERTVSKYRKQ